MKIKNIWNVETAAASHDEWLSSILPGLLSPRPPHTTVDQNQIVFRLSANCQYTDNFFKSQLFTNSRSSPFLWLPPERLKASAPAPRTLQAWIAQTAKEAEQFGPG